MATRTPRPRPLLSPQLTAEVEGWSHAINAAAADADMDPQTYRSLIEKLFPRIVDALAAGHVVKIPGFGILAPWALEKKRFSGRKICMKHPLYCVIRFRPNAKANAQVINQAPVRRATNARYLMLAAHTTDNCALRVHDARVARGEWPPRPDLSDAPRTEAEQWAEARAHQRVFPPRHKYAP